MIGTEFIKGRVQYKTIKFKGINMPSLLENKIPSLNGQSVKISELFENALIIRGCNMNKDGHDTNSKVLESSREGKVSLGGRISEISKRPFSAISVNGTQADLYKGVISSFKTSEGVSATNCRDTDESYIEQVLELFKNDQEINSEKSISNFFKKLSEELKDRSSYQYEKIKKISKLPFDKIYKDFKESTNKYLKLIETAHSKYKIKNINDHSIKGVSFPAEFKLNKEGSTDPLDYMGKFQLLDNILVEEDLNTIFENIDYKRLAQRFALSEVSLKYKLTNVLILNIDPFENITVKNAAPIGAITHTVNDKFITFNCSTEKRFSTSEDKALEFTNDAHYIGTLPTLIGYSKIYQLFSTCLYEFQRELKRLELFDKTLIHITSEFERSPQRNQAGSDHGWQGHTSTLISGLIKSFNVIGSIKESSSNILKDHYCTWGEADYHKGLKRQMRYGDIVTTIADIFNISSTEGGISLIKRDSKGLIKTKFREVL